MSVLRIKSHPSLPSVSVEVAVWRSRPQRQLQLALDATYQKHLLTLLRSKISQDGPCLRLVDQTKRGKLLTKIKLMMCHQASVNRHTLIRLLQHHATLALQGERTWIKLVHSRTWCNVAQLWNSITLSTETIDFAIYRYRDRFDLEPRYWIISFINARVVIIHFTLYLSYLMNYNYHVFQADGTGHVKSYLLW